jgi:hypothetical protein
MLIYETSYREVIKMFRELIDKLKSKRQQLQRYNTNVIETKPIEEEKEIDIKISKQDNIFKIEISDYISIGDYVNKTESSEEYGILDLICLSVLWNSNKQMVNKGIYYVITSDNRLYNILFTDDKIYIDERTKKEIDEQTQKKNITQERLITYNIDKNQYNYYSAKHEENRNTYYIKYYNKNRSYSLGALDLTEEETYEEVKSVISNLESIKGIETILCVELLKEHVLNDLTKTKIVL